MLSNQDLMKFAKEHGPAQVKKLREELESVKNFIPNGMKFYKKITSDGFCDLMLFVYVPEKVATYKTNKACGIQWRYLGNQSLAIYALGDVQENEWTCNKVLGEFFSLLDLFQAVKWIDNPDSKAVLIDKTGHEIRLLLSSNA